MKLIKFFIFGIIFLSYFHKTFERSITHDLKKNEPKVCKKPGYIRRMYNWVNLKASSIVKLVYDPEYNLNYKESIKKITTDSIDKKQNFFNIIQAENPNLKDNQRIRILFYLGTKSDIDLETNKAGLKLNIQNFVKHTEIIQNSDLEYYKAIIEILSTNNPKISNIINDMGYLEYSIYSEINEKIKKHFEINDLPIFEPDPLLRFAQKIKKKSNREIPSFIKDKTQFILDSLKKNIDLINSQAKSVLNTFNSAKKGIENTEILMNLSKALFEIDKIPVLEKINEKLGKTVEQIEASPIMSKIKIMSGRADIVSLMIKVEQGKASALDYTKLAQKMSKEFGLKSLTTPLNITKNLLEIKDHLENFNKSESAAIKIAEIFLALGNISSLSPDPISETITNMLNYVGHTINNYKSIQNIINEEVELTAKSFEKNVEEHRLSFFSQFYSDFAIDAFIYDSQEFKRTHGLNEIVEEIKQKYSVYSDDVKEVIANFNDERISAQNSGDIDRFSSIGSDWDYGYSRLVSNNNLIKISEIYNNFKDSHSDLPGYTYDITETDTEKCYERDIINSEWGRKKLRKLNKHRKKI